MPRLNSGYDYVEELGAAAARQNVVEYLARRYRSAGYGQWRTRVVSGQVLLDGIPASPDVVLTPGQKLIWRRPPWKEPDVPCAFAVLYRDEHLLAVAKPAGLPTTPGGGLFMENTLLALVRRSCPQANPLHRLGRGTSGIVLFARTREAFKKVSLAWIRRDVLKIYRALVVGAPAADEFDINTPIGKVPHAFLKTVHAAVSNDDGAAKTARSHVRVLERRDGKSLVDVQIVTGRPHQIRIHMAAAGHPLFGDSLYCAGGVPRTDSQALPGDAGYFLHSALLRFPHPATEKRIEVTCFPPPVLRTLKQKERVS